jgi:hypothetical protein
MSSALAAVMRLEALPFASGGPGIPGVEVEKAPRGDVRSAQLRAVISPDLGGTFRVRWAQYRAVDGVRIPHLAVWRLDDVPFAVVRVRPLSSDCAADRAPARKGLSAGWTAPDAPRRERREFGPRGPNGAEQRHRAQDGTAKSLSFWASASGSSPPFRIPVLTSWAGALGTELDAMPLARVADVVSGAAACRSRSVIAVRHRVLTATNLGPRLDAGRHRAGEAGEHGRVPAHGARQSTPRRARGTRRRRLIRRPPVRRAASRRDR